MTFRDLTNKNSTKTRKQLENLYKMKYIWYFVWYDLWDKAGKGACQILIVSPLLNCLEHRLLHW